MGKKKGEFEKYRESVEEWSGEPVMPEDVADYYVAGYLPDQTARALEANKEIKKKKLKKVI